MSLAAALALFEEVVDLSPEAQRQALQHHPRALADQVRQMLRADAASQHFLTGAGSDLVAEALRRDERTPQGLPGFTVLGEIGRGGMGRVFEARQARPDRSVALKMIHPWLVSERTRAQLHDEASALGAIIHPGVPQIYALEEAEGRLFLVMELVRGRSVEEAVAGRSTRDRVELGVAIGEAIAAAHSRGLLHLDIKPANVRVEDGGRPKVLDFGLARALDSHAAPPRAGTPGFMAPEQAEGLRPDVRTDVFGFGRLLRVLLTGALTGVPTHPDLSAVVGRADALRPEDRYASVADVVRDLRAWLDRRPTSARPLDPLSRALLAMRRNPVPAAAMGLVALVLVGASAWSFERAQRAERAQREAELARIEAENTRDEARRDARRAQETADFLTEVFMLLDPRKSTGERTLLDATLTALERLDDGALAEAPREEAAVRVAAAEALWNLKRREEASEQIMAAIALYASADLAPDATLVDALHSAAIVTRLGRHAEGVSEAVEMERAWAYLDRAHRLATELELDGPAAEILHSRGVWLHTSGRFEEAERALGRSVALKRSVHASGALSSSELANTLHQLGYTLTMRGAFDAAAGAFDEAHSRLLEDLSPPHPRIATNLHWQAILAVDRGDPARGLELVDQATAMRDAVGQSTRASSRSAEPALRGRALADLGRWAEAEAAMRTYIELELSGQTERIQRETAWTLIRALLGQGRTAEAREIALRAIARDEGATPNSGAEAWFHTLRGLWRARMGEDGAREDLETARVIWEARFGPDGPRTARVRDALGR